MDAFKTEELVPDVLDDTPGTFLQVSYNGTEVTPGRVMTPTQVKDKPKVTINGDQGLYYTLVFHDPDAPSRADPTMCEMQHWFVDNIPDNDVEKGEVLVDYIGAGAPKGTGYHRYALFLYKQPDKVDYSHIQKVPNSSVAGRRNQKARKIAEEYGLTLDAGTFLRLNGTSTYLLYTHSWDSNLQHQPGRQRDGNQATEDTCSDITFVEPYAISTFNFLS